MVSLLLLFQFFYLFCLFCLCLDKQRQNIILILFFYFLNFFCKLAYVIIKEKNYCGSYVHLDLASPEGAYWRETPSPLANSIPYSIFGFLLYSFNEVSLQKKQKI
jgi:hypothetical protein